uniref:Phosphatidylinositol-glycan biosynthesis class X protein n=1 Tax=Taeniopygia guttata TaxID=59729 RepID=A0A674H736_TAEGU
MAGGRRGPVRAGIGAALGALLCALHVQAACRDTTVTLELLKEGFHRDLLVKVELGEDAGGCAVAAQMRLPPGIYVDPYELATLQQHNLTKVMPSARSSGSESGKDSGACIVWAFSGSLKQGD